MLLASEAVTRCLREGCERAFRKTERQGSVGFRVCRSRWHPHCQNLRIPMLCSVSVFVHAGIMRGRTRQFLRAGRC